MADKEKQKQQATGYGILLLIIAGFWIYLTVTDDSASQPEFVSMPGLANYAMIIPPDAKTDALVIAAKDKCGDQDICMVHAWQNKADMARAFPMTDKELASVAFSFSINRTTGHEKALWNCAVFKTKKGNDCLATPD